MLAFIRTGVYNLNKHCGKSKHSERLTILLLTDVNIFCIITRFIYALHILHIMS